MPANTGVELTQELRRADDDERFLFDLGFNHCFILGKHLLNNSLENLNCGWRCLPFHNRYAISHRSAGEEIKKLSSRAGIAIMGVGGLSILLGVMPRLGGAMLAAFVLERGHSLQADGPGRCDVHTLGSRLPDGADGVLQTLQVSARLGHKSSALKNLALAAVGLFFVLSGSGPYSLWA